RAVRVNHQTGLLVLQLDELATPRERVEAQVQDLGFNIRSADIAAIESAVIGTGETAMPTEPPWWAIARIRQLAAIDALLVAGIAACSILLPAYRGWAALPAALFGLWVFGRRAVALARAGSS